VKASNNDLVWNETGKKLTIIILPVWWQTWWFRILIILIISGLFISAYLIRMNKIKNINRALEWKVQERTAQLEESNLELETFAYSVSHDLRAPLRGINGYAKVIEEDYDDELTENVRNYINKMVRASIRMGSLIDSILKLSRIIRTDINKVNVNISNLANEITEELNIAYPERKVEVIIQPNMYENTDVSLFRIVLENLIQNAWKFTRNNSSAKIEIGYIHKNGHKEYYVRDNGVGFNMKYANKLFIPFNRLHSDNEFEGMGIGLASVKKIIDKHGGQIRVESKINEGTIFSFTL